MKDTIICGDNCDVMAAFDDNCIDLVVTSPPYDNLRTYGGHSWDFEDVAQSLWRIVKSGGVVVWIVADATIDGSETGTSFRQALRFMDIGFRLHDTMIWKNDCCPFPESVRYYSAFQYMFVLSRGAPSTTNLIEDRVNKHGGAPVHGTASQPDGTKKPNNAQSRRTGRVIKDYGVRFNVWELASSGKPGAKHPAAFPEALARDHIRSWSNEGDIVLDPFSGSGTTAKMARELGRHYIGIEINQEYCDIAERRLAQKLLFGVPEERSQR